MQIRIVILGLLLVSCSCNQNEHHKLLSNSKNLDSNLRKALLKALTELENESGNNTSNFKNSDTVEKASASAISIFQRDNSEAKVEKTTETPEEDQKQIVVIQKSNGLQHRPITTFIPSNTNENFITSASHNYNFPRNRIVNQKSIPTTEKIEDLTSPSPTMETPTTEENEGKAEEVQFFSAPLVAAFTVHQDERGIPKSVEPIYKQSNHAPIVNDIVNKYNTQQEIIRQQRLKNEHLQTQIALQEKQKLLEEQLYTLQRQQKEQEQFLYRQQQLIQEQQHRLLEQNKINRNNDHLFVPNKNNQNQIDPTNSFSQTPNHLTATTPIIHNHIDSAHRIVPPSSQFNNANPLKSTVVFQTSVSLSPEQINKANELPLNAQHLPTKNFNDFKQTSPYLQHSFDQLNSVLLPPHQANLQNINYIQSVNSQQPPNIRIYRQEPVGNFYSNNNYNPYAKPQNYVIQPSVPLNVRHLRSNLENYQTAPGFPAVQPPVVKQQLTSLLHNSGINTGRHEDLDLISKILSYNHVGGGTRFYSH